MKQIYFPIDYRTFNDNRPNKEMDVKLISTKYGEITTQPMWRMEILAKYYGINIYNYDNSDDQRYYEGMMCALNLKEECEVNREGDFYHDRYDQYFQHLAQIAAEVGDERAEIKCLIKSLIMKYRFVDHITTFPHESFKQLYIRLTTSRDMDQLRVAERLSRHHAKELASFLKWSVKDTMWRTEIEKK